MGRKRSKRNVAKRARGLEQQIAKTERMRKQSLPRPKWLREAYEERIENEGIWDFESIKPSRRNRRK